MDTYKIACRECARAGESCCFDPRILPTMDEVDQLTAAGHKDFLTAYVYKGEGSWADKWDQAMVVEVDEKNYELCVRRGSEGSCVFLVSGKGCTLGDKRLRLCKVFPRWVSRGIMLIDSEFPSCRLKKMSMSRILQEINETPQSIIEYCEKIIEDGLQYKKERTILVKQLVDAGQITH